MDLVIGIGADEGEGTIKGTSEEVNESVDVVGGGGEWLGVGVKGIVFEEEGLLGLGGEFQQQI